MTNRERAAAVRDSLAVFSARTYAGRTPEQLGLPTVDAGIAGEGLVPETDGFTLVQDFLCDLKHYCDAMGIDFEGQLDRADFHYSEELREGWDDGE